VLSRIVNMRVMATELGFDVTTLVFPSTPGASAHADMLVDLPELLAVVDRVEAGGSDRQNGWQP
jgi:hypothetical protein